MTDATETATTYTPRPGSIPHRVLTFLVLNPEEELTRSDIAVKFDCQGSSVDTLLGIAVARQILKRGRNSDMEVVWSLGKSTDFVLDQTNAGAEPLVKLPSRCFPSARAAASESESYIERPARHQRPQLPSEPADAIDLKAIQVRKGVRLMTKEERRRAEFSEWFAQFEIGDSAEFDEVHLPTMKTECSRHMREAKTKFRFAATGPGRHGVERTA